MTGRTSRNKGAGAEREFTAIVNAALGTNVARKLGQAREGGDDVQLGNYRIEVKRRETLSIMAWCRQVEACCKAGEVPVVAFRQNSQEWRCVLKLNDLLTLIKGLDLCL